MQQVDRVRSATQAAAVPLVQKASDGVRALLKLVSSNESAFFKDGDIQAQEIKQQLSNPNTETKLVGLKRAFAAEAAACPSGDTSVAPSLFFADVLKNLSTSDFELKRLVYLYLVQHADQHPDLTLLSINAYQKDIYSSSHVIRSAALKSLSSLRMLEIVQLLLHSLKRAAADTSPLVRKTAAHAAAKIYYLDTDQKDEVVATLLHLLGDGETAVLGAALISFRLIFFHSGLTDGSLSQGGPPGASREPPQGAPHVNGASPLDSSGLHGGGASGGPPDSQEEVLALLHPFYKRLVGLLPQLQPAAQVVAVDLLTRYCRCFFRQPVAAAEGGPSPSVSPSSSSEDKAQQGAPDTRGPPAMSAVSLLASRGAPEGGPLRRPAQGEPQEKKPAFLKALKPLPEDLANFREALELLLLSDSTAVVVSACASLQCLFPASTWGCVVVPLLRCLYTCAADSKEPLLRVIAALAAAAPHLFILHMREFYLKQSDSYPVRQQKLKVLFGFALAFPASLSALLPEFRVYLQWAGDEGLMSSVFRILTVLALRHPQAQAFCMRLFVSLLDSPSAAVAAEAVVGTRTLVQQKQDEEDGDMLARLVLHLAAQLSRVTSPAARASLVWVVGKHHAQASWVAADALRQLTKRFRDEADDVKLQILLLAMRLWGFHLRNMHEGPDEQQQREASDSGGPPGAPQAEKRLIPPPTRQQSRQHFPRLDAMLRFLFEMAAYDSSFDVRDVARTYSALTSVMSLQESALPPEQRDMRRFAQQFLHELSSAAPSAHPASEASTLSPGEEVLQLRGSLGGPCAGAAAAAAAAAGLGCLWSSLAFQSGGLSLSGDVPLPPFAAADSADSLRQCLSEEEALHQSFVSLGVRPPRGGPYGNGSTPTAQGPRSICSADVIRQGNVASLMGRADGGKEPLSQLDLDSFYENDPLTDLACLNGTAPSVDSTECTHTRSSGVVSGEGVKNEASNEAVWAAFDNAGEMLGAAALQGAPGATPPVGLVVGEDEESGDDESPYLSAAAAAAAVSSLQQPTQPQANATLTCNQQTREAADKSYAPSVS